MAAEWGDAGCCLLRVTLRVSELEEREAAETDENEFCLLCTIGSAES